MTGIQLKKALDKSDRIAALAIGFIITASASMAIAPVPNTVAERTRTIKVVEHVIKMVPGPVTLVDAPIASEAVEAVKSKLLAEHQCLAEVMYYEARGEGENGERAVAEVVFHRMNGGGYGRSICAVVYEGVDRAGCQFSFACDGSRDKPKSAVDWRLAEALAARILTGEQPLADETSGAVNYHAAYVRPIWAEELVRTAQIGNHIFYRAPGHEPRFEQVAFRGSEW